MVKTQFSHRCQTVGPRSNTLASGRAPFAQEKQCEANYQQRGRISPVILALFCFNVEVMAFKTFFCSKITAPGLTLFTFGTHVPQPCMYLSVKKACALSDSVSLSFFSLYLSLSFRVSGCTAASTASTRPSSSKYLPSAPPHASSLRMRNAAVSPGA